MNSTPHTHQPTLERGRYTRYRIDYGDTQVMLGILSIFRPSHARVPSPRAVQRAITRAVRRHDRGSRKAQRIEARKIERREKYQPILEEARAKLRAAGGRWGTEVLADSLAPTTEPSPSDHTVLGYDPPDAAFMHQHGNMAHIHGDAGSTHTHLNLEQDAQMYVGSVNGVAIGTGTVAATADGSVARGALNPSTHAHQIEAGGDRVIYICKDGELCRRPRVTVE